MNSRTVITLGIILTTIVGAFAFLLTNPDAKKAMQRNVDQSVKQAAADTDVELPAAQKTAGKYIAYSEDTLAAAEGTKLIFFHAAWCPQCRAIEADIEHQGVPEGATILKADYDKSQQLRQKYGVTIQTTVVRVDDSGNLVKKYVAYDEPTLDSIIKNLL